MADQPRADKERIAEGLGASTTRPHPNGRCADIDCTICRHFRCADCGAALVGSGMRLAHRCEP